MFPSNTLQPAEILVLTQWLCHSNGGAFRRRCHSVGIDVLLDLKRAGNTIDPCTRALGTGTWNLIHAQMAHHCPLGSWKTDSIVARSVSTTGNPEGCAHPQQCDLLRAEFAQCPEAVAMFTDESRPRGGFIPAETLAQNGTTGDNGTVSTAAGTLNQAVLGFLVG